MTIKTNSTKAWILAARPKTLTGAGIPVLLGSALAISHQCFTTIPCIICFLFAFLMQIDANFINDYFDFIKGSDREDRLGPERACAQGWITLKAMRIGILITTLLASVAGLCLLLFTGYEMIPVGMACIIFAFLYTAGPYPLAYHGWGDLLVLVFFGFVPVGCTYYIMAHQWTAETTLTALACGFVIDTLLMVNNYRDRVQDAQSGKRTLIVRCGEKVGEQLYFITGAIAPLCCLGFVFYGKPYAALCPLLYLIPHTLTWREMVKIKEGKKLNSILGKTSRNMLFFGILLALGLILSYCFSISTVA